MTLYRIFRDERGFTLIELVIILILIGLLAGIAIPKYVDLTTQARNASAKATLDAARAAFVLAFASDVAANQTHSLVYTGTTVTSVVEGLMENAPRYPAGFSWFDTGVDGDNDNPASISATLNGIDVDTL